MVAAADTVPLECEDFDTESMNLRTAAFFALVGMAFWTVLTGINLVRAISAIASGIAPAVNLLTTLVPFIAALSLLIFFGVFYNSRP